MRTLKLTIAYDGTRYAGWQRQVSNQQSAISSQRKTKRTKPTIQGTLERVLSRILQEPVRVVGSGRTDAGVHALAQVAHVRTRRTVEVRRVLRSVNALLPKDIAVLRIERAAAQFHARLHATRKRYRYRIYTGQVVPPFIHPYVLHVRTPLNVALMRREADALRGRHDFKAFARVGGRSFVTVRTMRDVRVIRRVQEIHVEVEGDGFLHTMVRSIVGTLLDIGRARLPAGTVRRMVRTRRRDLAGTTAPARGLVLVSVTY